jgi:hypothetical protein
MFAAEWSLLMLDVIGAGALGAGMIVLIRRRRSPYLQACGIIRAIKEPGGD